MVQRKKEEYRGIKLNTVKYSGIQPHSYRISLDEKWSEEPHKSGACLHN